MIYRKDIDLLRTVAVLLVVIFHADKTFLTGGFIGVDVFFVISGYLITSIIYPKIKERKFCYQTFFIKRANRLLPASLTMTIVTTLIFAYLYPSNLFENVAEAALSSIFFVSNIYFWQTSGYFNPGNELQPFLHTWSLSLEEQFYIIWPFTLIILSYFALSIKYMLITMCIIISILLSIIFIPNEVSYIGYFVLPTRFFELGLGGLTAVYLFESKKSYLFDSKILNKDIGLVIIILSSIWLTPTSPFPGYLALLPVIGTLIFITAKKTSYLYKILDTRPALYIGLISYSLYLWHWPIITALKWSFNELSATHYIIYFVVSFLLAHISYRFIETSFKKQDGSIGIKKIGYIFCLTTALAGYLFISQNYILSPVPKIYHEEYSTINDYPTAHRICIDQARKNKTWEPCIISINNEHEPKIFVWGDSHAGAFMGTFEYIAKKYNITVSIHSGCPSLPNIKRKNAEDCHSINSAVLTHLSNTKYDLVVNISAWNNYRINDFINHDKISSNEEVIKKSINNLVKFYKKNQIKHLFVEQPPIFSNNVSANFFKTKLFNNELEKLKFEKYQKQKLNFEETKIKNEDTFNFSHYLCSNEYCKPIINNKLMYMDKDHISKNMTQLLSLKFEEILMNKFEENTHYRESK